MKKITTAVISYNAIPPYESGVTIINGRRALILPNTFNPKFPASVLPASTQNFPRAYCRQIPIGLCSCATEMNFAR